ncbi:MAG: high-potential iron-sulfur protein [Variovorax sp.]
MFLSLHRVAQSAAAKLDESDPVAKSLGYSQDTRKVDEKKYPKHVAAQDCAGCSLYKGAPKDAIGECPLFAGKGVSSGGWCSAWTKKAG